MKLPKGGRSITGQLRAAFSDHCHEAKDSPTILIADSEGVDADFRATMDAGLAYLARASSHKVVCFRHRS
jgi:hypothetical protein